MGEEKFGSAYDLSSLSLNFRRRKGVKIDRTSLYDPAAIRRRLEEIDGGRSTKRKKDEDSSAYDLGAIARDFRLS